MLPEGEPRSRNLALLAAEGIDADAMAPPPNK